MSTASAQQASLPVGTVYAERQSIAQTQGFVGRIESIERVDIRARVKGYLEQVLFKEGDHINKGDPLYHIEKGLFQAAVEQAQGALERSKAAKILTVIQLQRAEELLTKQAGTAVARDQALAADQQAQGQILSDQANLDTAKINLGYTDIASPITGKISRTNVTAGNVVGPDTGPLTLIVSQDPMYVTFPVSQREFLQAQTGGHSLSAAGAQSQGQILRRHDLQAGRHDQFRRCLGGPRHRYGARARHDTESRRRPGRRPVGQRRA